ncbi:MAG TPA: UDP-N-acetylmuramate dehydrogenase, partial [Azospirillaceae bacterium]|nr:UDP-N-acetylmuramate dehydrogenase [Azospirillaceae bacterium]
VGGAAEVLFRPADADDLADFLARLDAEVPVTVLGVASNLLVRDGGIPGVVIRLTRGFADVSVDGDLMTIGSGALDSTAAQAALEAGLGCLEFLSGVPGTIGGALRMNAGAYGGEIRDVFVSAEGVNRRGEKLVFDAAAMGFEYRKCAVPADVVFTRATLRGVAGDRCQIAARMAEIADKRGETQPVRARTGGSTFKNPPGHKAWELIDRAGCRGLTRGQAQVSEKHCNFLLNLGEATAAELEALGEEVRARVLAHSGVTLEWEIKRVGLPLGGNEP